MFVTLVFGSVFAGAIIFRWIANVEGIDMDCVTYRVLLSFEHETQSKRLPFGSRGPSAVAVDLIR